MWQEHRFEAVEPSFGEIAYAERLVGAPMEAWSRATSTRVAVFLAARRVDHNLLPWARLEDLGPGDFDVIDDVVPGGPDDERVADVAEPTGELGDELGAGDEDPPVAAGATGPAATGDGAAAGPGSSPNVAPST